MADLNFRGRATVELDDAKAWFASRSPRAAGQFERNVERSIGRITTMPRMYALIDAQHRFCPVEKSEYYLVYTYDSSTDVVDVVAVIHAKQQPRSWP